ncbi:MAG TPA: hypothetical protein VK826_02850, partial [Bacteroidia bacterium]|nr:hypothetical protein [Bacteroidia bacterium]
STNSVTCTVHKILLPFFLLCLVITITQVSCKKDDANPGQAGVIDPRAPDFGNYHFMIRTLTATQASGWVITEDTTYFDGRIYADPNGNDSIVVKYGATAADEITILVDGSNSFYVVNQFGTSMGALNESGAIVFSRRISMTTTEHIDHYVSGQRY